MCSRKCRLVCRVRFGAAAGRKHKERDDGEQEFQVPFSHRGNYHRKVKRLLLSGLALWAVLLALVIAAGVMAAEGALRVAPRPTQPPMRSGCTAAVIDGEPDRTSSNVQLHAWYCAPPNWNGSTVMVLHGIGDSSASYGGFVSLFEGHGYSVLLPDSRGHAGGSGLVTYGVLEARDIHRWAHWLFQAQHIHGLYGFGESLGGASILLSLATERRFSAVIAECSYADFQSIARERLLRVSPTFLRWFVPPVVTAGMLYTRIRYGVDLKQASPVRAAAKSLTPVLLIHGMADSQTSPENSMRISAANPRMVQLWLVPGADHTAAWATAHAEFERRVLDWFSRSGSPL